MKSSFSFTSPENVNCGPTLSLQLTMDMNAHDKEIAGDLINVVKNGL